MVARATSRGAPAASRSPPAALSRHDRRAEGQLLPPGALLHPRVRYHVGRSYGRTTSRMLTDPEVRKSPCSVLTPLRRPKFTGDFSQQRLPPGPDRMDQEQPYIPGYTGFAPYSGCFPVGPGFQPPLPRVLPLLDPPLWTEAPPAPLAAHGKDMPPRHPGIRLACGPGWRQFAATAGSQLASPKGAQRFLCHPDIALVCGQEEHRGPCKAGMSLLCGQGWRGPPCRAGTDQPTRTEGVPLPLATETVDVRRFDRTPRLDLPNLIQRKAISGYAGFIPCFTWIMGVNYLKGVKDAMNNFDRNQERLRNPMYSFGQRLPHTYWPNTKIYNSKGLVPFYTGFVPTIRESYALTFGNSTRKAYYDELQRRQHTG